MCDAGAAETDTEDNKDVQYLKAQVDTTIEEITLLETDSVL